jgi:single-strand DNA-binding protein
MSGINRVFLIGNLGNDPDTKTTAGGTTICSFSIATSEKWKDKTTNEMKEKTEWSNCTAFGKLGEVCAQYLKKGSKVYVEGKLSTDKYKHKDHGIDMYSTKIIVGSMQMLDSKPKDATAAQNAPSNAPQQFQSFDDEFSDDIPF